VHLKVCSTFDSTGETGNLALAAQALTTALALDRTVVIGGQPSLGRYCVFGTLFAADATGAVHRLDRHPVMSQHSVTPMTEADLSRHLDALGLGPVALHTLRDLRGGLPLPDAEGPVLCDALEADDIARIGALLRKHPDLLVVGASSVAEALVGPPMLAPSASHLRMGPILAFAGSRSEVSAAQVAAARRYATLPLHPADILDPRQAAKAAVRAGGYLESGENVLLDLQPERVVAITPARLAKAGADLLERIMAECRPGALVIAGGDSSSVVMRRLAPHTLDYAGAVEPGIALCLARFEDAGAPLPVVLKGGQMGRINLFDQLACDILPASL